MAPATEFVERTHPTGWHRLRAGVALVVLVVALGVLSALVVLGALAGLLWVLVRSLS